MSNLLSNRNLVSLSGFGQTAQADGYYVSPSSVEAISELIKLAGQRGRKILFRGAGRSYGDANILAESIVVDLTRLNRILNWDPLTGRVEVEGGVTIEDLWRHCLPDGWWVPVVSGTMFPTLGGALAMNIHGKNCGKAGPLANYVEELDILDAKGELHTLRPGSDTFNAVIGGMGLLGPIVRVVLRLHEVSCGFLDVQPVSIKNIEHHFQVFSEFESWDYRVSWVDGFPSGNRLGRGLFHAARYASAVDPVSLKADHQDLPDTLFGLLPKSVMWRFLKPFTNRAGMRLVNGAKYTASAVLPSTPHPQSLVGFSFLLDYVPNWRRAYEPGGLIQYQSFVPKEHAERVFAQQLELQQQAGLENFLGVLKRHQPDPYWLSHAVDGFSYAADFKVTAQNRERLWKLCHQMNELVLEAGGKFYFAKDSTLRKEDVRRSLGEDVLKRFGAMRDRFDPERIFSNQLAERLLD